MITALKDKSKGLPIRNRKYRFRTFKQSVVGYQVVDWIYQNVNVPSREAATQLAQEFLNDKVLECASTPKANFVDGYIFYRFADANRPDPHSSVQEYDEIVFNPISLDKTIRIEGDGKTEKNDWIFLSYDSVFNSWSCYHLDIKWISGCGIVEFVSNLHLKAKMCGMTLVQLPIDEVTCFFPMKFRFFFFLNLFFF